MAQYERAKAVLLLPHGDNSYSQSAVKPILAVGSPDQKGFQVGSLVNLR